MKGLKVNFNSDGITIDTEASVDGLEATIQNALLNIATRKGTDKVFPNKGTDLLHSAVTGKIVGINDANHVSQFAALDTLFFIRQFDITQPSNTRIGKIFMQPVSYNGHRLLINATFTDIDGTRTVGTSTSI